MRVLAREAAAGLAFVAVGVAVSLGVALVQGVAASPDPALVLRGMDPYYGQTCWPWYDPDLPGHHPCWHDEDSHQYTAVDFDYGDSTGREVALYISGYEYFKILPYTGTCKGVRAGIYWGDPVYGDYRGDIHYLHINVLPDVIGRVTTGPYLPLGHVAWPDNPGCDTTGAHLHQSARITAETPFYTNKLSDPVAGDNWVHAVMWESGTADTDGDAWINKNELYIGTDHMDNCPDNTSDDAWPPDVNNNKSVDILDVLLFKPHMNCSVGQGCYDNRYDLNVDGVVNIIDILLYKPILDQHCT